MQYRVNISIQVNDNVSKKLLAPIGVPTPYQTPIGFKVEGGECELTGETTTGQLAALISTQNSETVDLIYEYAEVGTFYPEQIFRYRPSKYTKPAEELVEGVQNETIENSLEGIKYIANQVAEKFTYGHPDNRFNDGHEEVPYLSCGVTAGSCVDINTYFMAVLRTSGFEAGYITGYFFPEEKKGMCVDSHCWVVTRFENMIHEWDIAHHLKMDKPEILPGLNPKPGIRFAVAHSMGLDFPALNVKQAKLMDEPVWVDQHGNTNLCDIVIRYTAI